DLLEGTELSPLRDAGASKHLFLVRSIWGRPSGWMRTPGANCKFAAAQIGRAVPTSGRRARCVRRSGAPRQRADPVAPPRACFRATVHDCLAAQWPAVRRADGAQRSFASAAHAPYYGAAVFELASNSRVGVFRPPRQFVS